jgi:hypothetical protein
LNRPDAVDFRPLSFQFNATFFPEVVSVSASNEWPFVERRRSNRPKTGDRRACPSCGDVMRFYERYVVSRGAASTTQPAWVCRCGHEQYVRQNRAVPHS